METVSLKVLLKKREEVAASRENLKMQLGGHDGALQILDELIAEAKGSEKEKKQKPEPVPHDEAAEK